MTLQSRTQQFTDKQVVASEVTDPTWCGFQYMKYGHQNAYWTVQGVCITVSHLTLPSPSPTSLTRHARSSSSYPSHLQHCVLSLLDQLVVISGWGSRSL